MYSYRTISVIPRLPEEINRLCELAYNLWFSWNPHAQSLFSQINGELWEQVYHNPVKFLLWVGQEELEQAVRDESFMSLYSSVIQDFENYMNEETWFQRTHPEQADKVIAYFSAEFGVHESHPTYSGGLGLLAGDHCKSASDLGLPFIGIGLLYKHGYFMQRINRQGWQEAEYPYFDFNQMPILPVKNKDGSILLVPVDMPGRKIYLKVWQMKVGRIIIYFLDADTQDNSFSDRKLTGQLYGGDREMRICQEILLGIGGVKALRAMGIHPCAWHINEGHAAFLCLERIMELVKQGIPFSTAVEAVRANTLFTTHTPVPAGHDMFSEELIDKYFSSMYLELGIKRDEFLALARDQERNQFNMTLLALKLSAYCNGVSRLHGEVTREMLKPLYGSIPVEEIPVSYITNGVHTETWMAEELKGLFDHYLDITWRKHISRNEIWEKVPGIPDERIWSVHQTLKERLIRLVRTRIKEQRIRNQELSDRVREAETYLQDDVLTVGFARRFATYKRANLLLKDRERLTRLVNDPERPIQFIFAGKAHPADFAGSELIKQIYDLSEQEPFKGKIVFLENYDINLARHLVQGVDVWLNTPRRPMEASGTSGQKAALNGVVNCSVLDGWWPEAYDGENGFALGETKTYLDEDIQDRDDCLSLYTILEEYIAPLYYHYRENGIPLGWVRYMKASMKTISPVFSTERMVREYTQTFYIPAIKRYLKFYAGNYEAAQRLGIFKKFLAQNWHHTRVSSVKTNDLQEMHVGDILQLSASVNLGPINYKDVSVEILYGNLGDQGLYNVSYAPMIVVGRDDNEDYIYKGSVVLPQGTIGYTVRIRPHSQDLASEFELPLVTWAQGF